MKKFFISFLYLALTLAVCAAGFLLPSTLNDYQDRQIFATIEHTAMEPPELTYSSSLYDTLRLLSHEHYFVEYPSAGSKRNDKEIYAISSGLIDQLKQYGTLLPDGAYDITNYTASLQLAIVSDNMPYTDANSSEAAAFGTDAAKDLNEHSETAALDITTAVVWSCAIYFESGYWMHIWIDDKSGKAVSFSMYTGQNLILASYTDAGDLDAFAAEVAAFAEDYYELPATPLQQSIVHAYNQMFEKGSIFEAYYTIQLKEEDGGLIQMPLRILQDCMTLN